MMNKGRPSGQDNASREGVGLEGAYLETRYERDELRAIGDMLQSEGSRLAEFVRLLDISIGVVVPYEVQQAYLAVEGAVADWTAVRSGSPSSARTSAETSTADCPSSQSKDVT